MSEAVMKKNKFSVIELVYMAMFAALMAVCSWVSIPAPEPFVPFTMQTFGVFITLLMLGGKRGGMSILVFILMAAVGLPVLAGFSGGIGALLGATGGYILGFLIASPIYIAGEKLLGDKQWVKAVSLLLGLIVCYAFGTSWFMSVYTKNTGEIGLMTALGWCVIPYIIPDVAKIVLAVLLTRRLRPYVDR